ncbi:BAG family molecular chaperone regulator 6 [Beta vulgaris subsp. vulgaris]|uniref:BAG family molecular chaperone regulator 6 n=1 Tax=Beta vulgaris subsp. vulgaris TaxID=3555 RepID=UPI0009018EA9|nr:BAG family molecular chaperone regulator 6 [Beta vulgaris subsp. vulgaris]
MEFPFFRAHYESHTPPQYNHHHHHYHRHYHRVPTTASSRPIKIIEIPIHSGESVKKRSESSSALTIQKTFRGFRVRKTVKKILEVKKEVDAVEKKLQERETMDVIKRDGREKLKVNEALMALLFKLDSVQGFDYGVREFRKAVIRKAIMLQELIDSAIDDDDDGGCTVEERENEIDSEGINGLCEMRVDNLEKVAIDSEEINGKTVEIDLCQMRADNPEKVGNERENSIDFEEINGETLEIDADNSSKVTEKRENGSNVDVIDDEKTLEKAEEIETCNSMQVESVKEETTEEQTSDFVEVCKEDDHEGAENHEGERTLKTKSSSNDEWFVVGDEKEDRKEKLLEKMAEDNRKLMVLVADLCQKNTTQTRMICSLSQRVELLEKAMTDRLRKKKKK